MSIPVFRLREGMVLPVTPKGKMLNGWLPGTVVNFVPSNNGTLEVDWASENPNNIGCGGFTINGSYDLLNGFDFRFANQNEESGFWTPDERVRYAKGEEASMSICLDGSVDDKVLDFLKNIKNVYFVSYIKKLES